ncbi:MAG: group III truncated hemoglobin [Candidatus Cyclobacteriaceae bacterium M2_1C_046]
MKKDIENRKDVKLLVDTFYDKVNQDKLLAPVFNDVAAVNWDTHLPKMYDFWETLLFGTQTYKGRPFDAHMALPLSEDHFRQWVKLFTSTVDELFAGQKAEEAKTKAENIAGIFKFKMHSLGLLNEE